MLTLGILVIDIAVIAFVGYVAYVVGYSEGFEDSVDSLIEEDREEN